MLLRIMLSMMIVTTVSWLNAAEIVVQPGSSIQAAVKAANKGDVIKVEPGVYHETVYVDKDGISLIGVIRNGQRPILDGKDQLNDAILVAGHHSVVENFHPRNYKGNGIMHQGSNNYAIRFNIVENTGVYGIFPQLSHNGVIEDNVLWGIADAAIYVGMCEYVDVRRNETFENVAGIEIENSSHVLVENNTSHNNTGGILVFVLPGLPVKSGSDVIVRNNMVLNNNMANWAAPGSVVANIPQGTGILVMAADDVTIENNIVRGNNSGGILVADLSLVPGASDPQVEPNTDELKVLNNVYLDNGKDPQGLIKAFLHGFGLTQSADVVSAGQGKNNCLADASRVKGLGTQGFTACAGDASTAAITTKTLKEPIPAKELAPHLRTKLVFDSVCSGCHTYDINLIGPPIIAIQALYKDKADEMLTYIKNPEHKRTTGPPMPRQDYMPDDVLRAVVDYMLDVKKEQMH